jgi:hypothetical protein
LRLSIGQSSFLTPTSRRQAIALKLENYVPSGRFETFSGAVIPIVVFLKELPNSSGSEFVQ